MDVEREVNLIADKLSRELHSREIIDFVKDRLPETVGVIVIELRGGDESTVYRSCSLQRAIYELHMAEQMLVNVRLSDHTVDHDERED